MRPPESVTVSPGGGLDEFRQQAREWIIANLPRRVVGDSIYGWQTGEGHESQEVLAKRSRELQRRVYDGGFAGLALPEECGGRGLTPAHAKIFNEEGAGYALPNLFGVTLGVIAPTLVNCAPGLAARHLPAMLRGDELWVQLLSEPSNGSDLAGALTKAVPTADGWIVTGSKIWTTGAHYSDYGFCLARTDWDVPKHAGLSVFAVPLRAAGVTIAPIKQSSGGSEFCQVFLDDVALPADSIVGAEGQGWQVILDHLEHERAGAGGGGVSGGLGGGVRLGGRVQDLVELATARGTIGEPAVRRQIGQVYAEGVVHAFLAARVQQGMECGALPEVASAMLKLFWGERAVRRTRVGMDLAGSEAIAWRPDASNRYGIDFISARQFTVAGGTEEMQRNLISERLLGLPKEPAADRGKPFRVVRTNTDQA